MDAAYINSNGTTVYYDNSSRDIWVGDKYESTKGMSTKQIAELIRKDIAARFPSKQGYKFSVRTHVYAGGSSINVEVKEAPGELFDYFGQQTDFARDITHHVIGLIDRYRYDESDGQIDYFNTNFYGSCRVSYESSQNLGYLVYNQRVAEAKANSNDN